jgi:hypothetical protein
MIKAQNTSHRKISSFLIETFPKNDFRGRVYFKLDSTLAVRYRMRIDASSTYYWLPQDDKKERFVGLRSRQMKARKSPRNAAAELSSVRPINVFEIRDRFFKIVTPEDGLRLFTRYGLFDDADCDGWFPPSLSFADLLSWQDLLKQCHTGEPREWEVLSRRFAKLWHVEDIFQTPETSIILGSPTKIRLYCEGIRGAVLTAIFLDKLGNVKSSFCQRAGCDVVYNHETKHERKYCSPDCAHAEAVRKSRQRKAGT